MPRATDQELRRPTLQAMRRCAWRPELHALSKRRNTLHASRRARSPARVCSRQASQNRDQGLAPEHLLCSGPRAPRNNWHTPQSAPTNARATRALPQSGLRPRAANQAMGTNIVAGGAPKPNQPPHKEREGETQRGAKFATRLLRDRPPGPTIGRSGTGGPGDKRPTKAQGEHKEAGRARAALAHPDTGSLQHLAKQPRHNRLRTWHGPHAAEAPSRPRPRAPRKASRGRERHGHQKLLLPKHFHFGRTCRIQARA